MADHLGIAITLIIILKYLACFKHNGPLREVSKFAHPHAASAPYPLPIFLCLDSVPVHFSKYLNSFSYLYCSNWLVRSAYIHDDRAFPVPPGTCSSSKLDTPTPSNLNVRSHTVRATSISQVARVGPRVLVSHLSLYRTSRASLL